MHNSNFIVNENFDTACKQTKTKKIFFMPRTFLFILLYCDKIAYVNKITMADSFPIKIQNNRQRNHHKR